MRHDSKKLGDPGMDLRDFSVLLDDKRKAFQLTVSLAVDTASFSTVSRMNKDKVRH